MAHFCSEKDLFDAMGAMPTLRGWSRPPRMSKAKLKKFVPMPAWEWPCGCTGMPGSRERGDYYLLAADECEKHQNLVGNFPRDESSGLI